MFRKSLENPQTVSSFLPLPTSSSPKEALLAAYPQSERESPKACIFGIK